MITDPKNLSVERLLKRPSVRRNLNEEDLARLCVETDSCRLASNGAVVAYSGKFTGRTPKDKFIVEDQETEEKVWWDNNARISPEHFAKIRNKAFDFLEDRSPIIMDMLAGADLETQLKVRFVLERPYHALFISQLLIKPTEEQLADFEPDWIVIDACRMLLDPVSDGSRSEAGILLNFTEKQVIIAGTEYAGEIKKSIFTIMNYLLPLRGMMSMHCSANIGEDGDSALFFGLSGTGKTSLSADPNRRLIGDDEHGWSDRGIFNIEGGCYAKCINLSHAHEPEIWDAIRPFAVLENVVLDDHGDPRYEDLSLTENTRAAYSLDHISNAVFPSIGGHPKNIVFLTCDALGLLPPISRLTPNQVMVYFLNGYTAKVAGTEAGVTEPTLTFSACFGQPFLPLSPHVYAKLLEEKIARHGSKVWLINTGWTEGGYGIGRRIPIEFTRSMLEAALKGDLDEAPYSIHETFELQYPTSCPNVPSELLNPKKTWTDQDAYDQKAAELQKLFRENAVKFGLSL